MDQLERLRLLFDYGFASKNLNKSNKRRVKNEKNVNVEERATQYCGSNLQIGI